jgi:hypothetical protein
VTATVSSEQREHQMRLTAISLLLLIIVLAPVLLWYQSARSSAAFADSEVLATNHLGAGILDLEVGEETVTFEANNLAPGDKVSGHLELVNAGTLPILLEVTGTSDGDLLAQWLRFDLWHSPTACSPDDIDPRFASDVVLTQSPAVLLGSSPTTTSHESRLAVGETTVFCLGSQLLLDAPNEVQGRRTEIDLVVIAVHDIEADIEAEQ